MNNTKKSPDKNRLKSKSLSEYSGQNVSHKSNLKMPLVISKNFDQGKTYQVTIQKTHAQSFGLNTHAIREYDIAQSAEEFVEYDVVANRVNEAFTFNKSLPSIPSAETGNRFITSNRPTENSNASVNRNCNCQNEQNPNQNRVANETVEITQQAPATTQSPIKPETSLAQSHHSEKDDNDDFLADMKSILSGIKTVDPKTKKVVDKSDLFMSESEESTDDFVKPLDQKSEHAIFDQIAKSMKYANTYDLGTTFIENRFDDFDRMNEFATKPISSEKSTISKATTKYPEAEPSFSVSTSDFVEDLDTINRANGHLTSQPMTAIPLDPGVGGRSIPVSTLDPGDILVSTTSANISRYIRQATRSEISHSAIYIGDNNIIESVEDGVLQRSVETAIADDTVVVAYRHVQMTPDKATIVVNYLKEQMRSGKKFDYNALVRILPAQLASAFCDSLTSVMRGPCHEVARTLRHGGDANDEFYCSELVFDAYRQANLSISDIEPSWSVPQDVMHLLHNGTLRYVGHLKTT